MANIIKKDPEPPKKNNPAGIALLIASVIAFITGVVLYIKLKSPEFIILCAAAAVLFVVSLTLARRRLEPSESKWYGNMGESKAGFVLENYLPNDYIVIQNAVVEYNGERSEIDNIVIGKTGVFIIEVKNMKGTVEGNYKKKYWFQTKFDHYGIEHKRKMYSPVGQVGTHIYRLANYLRENKIFVTISGAVFFASSQTKLKLGGKADKIPVFTYGNSKGLINYIKNGKPVLNDETVDKIFELLK